MRWRYLQEGRPDGATNGKVKRGEEQHGTAVDHFDPKVAVGHREYGGRYVCNPGELEPLGGRV